MKQLRMIAAAGSLMALTSLAMACCASATTLEVKGVKQTGAVTIRTSLKSGTSMLPSDTSGFFFNTCSASAVEGKTSALTGTRVEGPISSLTFTSCKEEPVIVDSTGTFSIENIAGTTNGTVRWIGTKWTMSSPFGQLTCLTAASPGTDIGILTGVATGYATMDISAAFNCGALTLKWTGTYTATSPEGLGVSS